MEEGPVLPVYVLDEAAAGRWAPGGAARWWLHGSLASLGADLARLGASLVLQRGSALEIIPDLAARIGARCVHAARSHEPWARALDRAVAARLEAKGVRFRRHLSTLLFPPEQIRTGIGGVYRVFTPFARACFDQAPPPEPRPAPTRIDGVTGVTSVALDDFALLPTRRNWTGGLQEAWQPGEAGARARLRRFFDERLEAYGARRDFPGDAGTSGLSAHLHHGEISPGTVWHAAKRKQGAGAHRFVHELLWREYSAYLLWHYEHMAEAPLRARFAAFPWREDAAGLHAWQRGQTGIPIVDAGMRELWRTGWMHNRVRMIAASFLVKHLLIRWQEGAAWFWDTLVDADLASNSASWQWVAGCGADAAPYFRIFNPVLQGKKFDPDGVYVRRYVPELASLPDAFVQAPWEAPEAQRRSLTYPAPICDLAAGRERALAAFARIKEP